MDKNKKRNNAVNFGYSSKRINKSKSFLTGFTLIEILFVVLIIGILAAVIVIAMAQAAKEKARIAQGQRFADSLRAKMEEGVYGSNIPGSYWKFDEGSGTFVKDAWGGNSGTVTGAIFVNSEISGSALSFSGAPNNYVSIANNPSLQPKDAVTVSLWFKASSFAAWIPIVEKSGSSDDYGFTTVVGGSQLRFFLNDSAQAATTSTTPFMNKWTYAVGTYDKNNIKLYIDGKLMATSPSYSADINQNSSPLLIGGNASSSNNMIIDEVRVYGAAITAQQVQQRYAESAPRHGIALK